MDDRHNGYRFVLDAVGDDMARSSYDELACARRTAGSAKIGMFGQAHHRLTDPGCDAGGRAGIVASNVRPDLGQNQGRAARPDQPNFGGGSSSSAPQDSSQRATSS